MENSSGMHMDYTHTWARVAAWHELLAMGRVTEDQLMQRLAKPVETYEEYHINKYPTILAEAMEKANPQALLALDRVVREYNALSIKQKLDFDRLKGFIKRVERIISSWT
jgi:hypothetical protein